MWTRNKKQALESAGRSRQNRGRIGAIALTTLCATLSLFSGIVRADPTGTAIYLYDSNGNPVNVTSQYVYNRQDPHVYTTGGTSIGTVDSASYIDNASNQHIGYITYLD